MAAELIPGSAEGYLDRTPCFRVRLPGAKPLYIADTPEYSTTPVQDEAAVFQLHLYPTPAQARQIEIDLHEMVGGFKQFFEMEAGIAQLRGGLWATLEQQVWPEGRPKLEPDQHEEQAAQTSLLQEAWRASDDSRKQGLMHLQDMVEGPRFVATWTHLVLQAPDGWQDLREKRMPATALQQLHRAYTEAMESTAEGND